MDKLAALTTASGAFVEDLYQRYLQDPQSVDPTWQSFFAGFDFGSVRSQAGGSAQSDKEVAVMKLINAYRDRGHLVAKTKPIRPRRFHKADLDLEYFGLSEADLDLEFDTGNQIRLGRATLRAILAHLQATYCGSIGAEYRYISDSDVRVWLHQTMEPTANKLALSLEEKHHILQKLVEAVGFEKFLHTRYAGQKRFSMEGSEAFIPALDALFSEGARLGVQEFVMGMAHRGRLNVLVNLFGKSYTAMFSEFEGNFLPDAIVGDGDVKYHQGHSADITTCDGHALHLSLPANPSHLEAVDPVVLGSVRAKCERLYQNDVKAIVPILVHGDAAIAGQGVVYETLNMAKLAGYSVGGTIHIVINNQVGFTANSRETRSTLYCTDIAKTSDSPVFHVNADDPEAVVNVMRMAINLRQRFGLDVYIDLMGYRRFGHNEGDDPLFTQPQLYTAIAEHPTVLDIYTKTLVERGDIAAVDAASLVQKFEQQLDESLRVARTNKPPLDVNFLGRQWKGYRRSLPADFETSIPTGVDHRRLSLITDALSTVPEGFDVYPKLRKILAGRKKLFEEGQVDWALGELLAYGTLLCELVPIRLSGQDSRRGTFSHRHSVLIDAKDETEYTPLNHILKNQEQFQVYNSHLSEYGVLGFEYGYSVVMPSALVLWEAQFGDFANGAQIMIDQFICASESKWQRMTGLVMLLPHGYEGQGPEHSSARIGRYLSLCAEDNIVVAYPTTPANYFHLLRRQVKVPYRKPLVVMTPKSLLRHPAVRSSVAELEDGRFREIIDDPGADPKKLKRVLLCAGKIYYELLEARLKSGCTDTVGIVRIEQFYPIPRAQDRALIEKYKRVEDWVWVQEEPVNMGGWDFIMHRFNRVPQLRVVSRRESASPATGSLKLHQASQAQLLQQAFDDL